MSVKTIILIIIAVIILGPFVLKILTIINNIAFKIYKMHKQLEQDKIARRIREKNAILAEKRAARLASENTETKQY